MRTFVEILAILLILTLAMGLGTAIIWIAGIPFQLDFKASVWISVVGLGFLFPAVGSVWDMFREERLSRPERVCTGLRAFGMMMCAMAILLTSVVIAATMTHGLWMFGIGLLFWWGSMGLQDHFGKKRMIAEGVFHDSDEPIDWNERRRHRAERPES